MDKTKFRVWDGEEMHEPIHDFLIASNGTLHRYNEDDEIEWGLGWGANECEVMQYTGLDDAEGTPIYEGDVVRLGTDRDAGYSRLALVVWEAPMFVYSPIQGSTSHWGLNANMDAKPLFVVGNKFEDAHALNDTEAKP